MQLIKSKPTGICRLWGSRFLATIGIAAGLLLGGHNPQAAQAAPGIGVYTGGGDMVTPYDDFGTWLGQPVQYRISYQDQSTWTSISGIFFETQMIQWLSERSTNREVLGVALCPYSDVRNFASVSNGSHDTEFKSLGTAITNSGHASQVIVRLAWEHNGYWFPWSVATSDTDPGDPAGFVAAFQRAVTDIRSTCPGVKVCWNPNLGTHGAYNWTSTYPGDSYVDYIGIDVYDFYDPNGFSDFNGRGPGVDEIRNMAVAHSKLECIPEWGLEASSNAGHDDDPNFIQSMYNWVTASSNVAFTGVWNDTCCSTLALIHTGTNNVSPLAPNSAALYKTLFGSVAPGAPSGLGATGAQNTQIPLSWTAGSGATSYSIYRGTTAGGESTTAIATGVTTTSYTNTGLTNGQIYYYKVKSVNSSGTSGYSNEASATPASYTGPIANGTYTLAPANATGLRLDVAGSGTTNATNVDAVTSSGGTNQQWVATLVGTNSYKFSPVNALGEVLDCNGQTTTSGTNVQLWADAGQQNQHWSLTAVSGGYTLTPQHATGLRLNNTGTASGSNVNITTANSSTAQTWSVVSTGTLPTPIIKLRLNENTGTTTANAGSAGGSLTLTATHPVWSTNVPVTVGGTSSVDFGTTTGNYGVDSAAAITALSGLTKFTITGWVNCRSNTVGSGGNRVVTWINNGANGVDLVYNADGSMTVGINQWPDGVIAHSTAGQITTDAAAGAANWRYFAVTYDSTLGSNNVQWFFGSNTADATSNSSQTYARGAVGASVGPLTIGHFNVLTRSGATDRMFRGIIDDVRVYGTVLTPAQVISNQRTP